MTGAIDGERRVPRTHVAGDGRFGRRERRCPRGRSPGRRAAAGRARDSGVAGRARDPGVTARRERHHRAPRRGHRRRGRLSRAHVDARVRRFEIAAQGISGDLELLSARPNKLRYRVTIAGIGRIESGYDGSIGWTVSPIAGPELLSGQQLADAADDAWFDATLHQSPHVRQLTVAGRAAFDGHDAYKVAVVLASGRRETEYFDVGTGLQIGSEGLHATPQGEVATVNVLRDYRAFGAVLQPTTIIQRALGFEQVVTITSCEYNAVPDTAFEPPAAIRALLKP
jgi:hypothetical protein